MDFDYGLLAKYLADTITPDEMGEVVDWSNLSSENKNIYSELVRLRVSWNAMYYNDVDRIDHALKKLNVRIDRLSYKQLLYKIIQYAAIFLVLFSFSYGAYDYFKPEKQISITVKSGEDVRKVVLVDGTSVWLRGGSTLKYPESYSIRNRQVSLQGEAFFDVIKNAESQFCVSTGYMHVLVKGTSFDVKVDVGNKKVETVLVTGKIDLLDIAGNKVLDVSPGEKVTYYQSKNEYTMEAVDSNIYTAWRLNQFVFENATLREIANKLSVKFNVNINIESSILAQRKFRCVINEDESLPDILKLLTFLAPIRYRIEGKEIFIYE
nr:FecR family protein [Parabacteroides goldsteinii]